MHAVNNNPQLRLQLFFVLLMSAIIANIFGGYFTRFFVAEIVILSIFAISLDSVSYTHLTLPTTPYV